MWTRRRIGSLGIAITAGAVVLSGAPAMAAATHSHAPTAYTCTGGEIRTGHYASLTVTGACSVAAMARIHVVGDVTVAAGATLDAQSAPSRMFIGGDVTAARGALLGLGCQPDFPDRSGHPCTVDADGSSVITVKGDITANDADAVLINGITDRGNITLVGGGDPNIPWSIKNNSIGHNLTVIGQTTQWLGALFNTIGGNATLLSITLHDPDPGAPGVYVVRNTIRRNLTCDGLRPGVSGGFIPGEVNTVGGHAYGQCKSLV